MSHGIKGDGVADQLNVHQINSLQVAAGAFAHPRAQKSYVALFSGTKVSTASTIHICLTFLVARRVRAMQAYMWRAVWTIITADDAGKTGKVLMAMSPALHHS